ncbi:MAG: hypothetical protein L3J37_02420 [Rhodobacteraceae bacterium]|nr:hypothetical protein [Paracoccaceae bacterium]
MKKLVFLMAFWAGATQAQVILNAEDFDTLSQGTTMYFSENGRFYGAEQFLPDRRSVWRAEDGSCVNGKWYQLDRDICFLYDNEDSPHCWEITTSADGLTVTSTTENPSATPGVPPLVLKLSGQDRKPILCTGPRFGV